MRFWKILILLLVGLLVFGSLGLWGYTLFVKPYAAESILSFLTKKKSNPPVTTTPVDPSIGDFQAALKLQQEGKLLEAQGAWQQWLSLYPSNPKRKEALLQLGKINMELFSTPSASSVEMYTVIKGDSLDRIARKRKSNPELIQRLNHLPSINLQIGELLYVPTLNTSLQIDRRAGLLILKNNDQLLKSYSLLSAPPQHVQSNEKQSPSTTTLLDMIATAENKRIAFGNKKYPQSNRVLLLRSHEAIVTAPQEETPASSTQGTPSTAASTLPPSANFVISVDDMKELFPFLTKESSIVIN